MVNNAHPHTWSIYIKFQPDWSINEYLAGIMTSYGCGNDQITLIYARTHAHMHARTHACTHTRTHARLGMLTKLLGNLIQNFRLVGCSISLGTWRPHANLLPNWFLINFFQAKRLPVGVGMEKPHPLLCLHVFSNAHSDS